MNILIQERNNHRDNCITIKNSRVTQKVKVYLANEESSLAIYSTDLRHTFGGDLRNDSGILMRGKEPHEPTFAYDIVPNDTCAIINTQPSDTPGEHWIKIAKFHHDLFFAGSFGLSINNYPFLKQNYSQMVRTSLQHHPSVCGFYTIYAAFHLFVFQQEEMTVVHDVHVLPFKSNFKELITHLL